MIILFSKWWAHLASNQGPTGYEPVALPAELWALSSLWEKYCLYKEPLLDMSS